MMDTGAQRQLTIDLKEIFKRLDDLEANPFSLTGGGVPAAGTAFNHLEDDGAAWTSVAVANFGTTAAGGGSRLALQVDQDAVTDIELVNASALTAVGAFYRAKNAPGAGGDNALNMGVLGAGFTTAAPAYQDSGMIQTGANLSGGLTIRTLPDVPMYFATNATRVNMQVSSAGLEVNPAGLDLDTQVQSNNQTHMLFVDGGNDVIGIRSSGPAAVAEGLHVPWVTGDGDATAQFGSANIANNQNAIEALSDSGYGLLAVSTDLIGVAGSSATGIGVEGAATTSGTGGSFKSATGVGLVVNLTGAGTAIADFNDNGASVLTIQDGGNILLGPTATLDLNGIANALILDTDADTTISAPTDDQIDFEIAGADDFTMTANAFNALDGSKLKLGTGGDGELYSSGDDVYIANVTQDKDFLFQVNDGGVTKTALFIDGSQTSAAINTTTTAFTREGSLTSTGLFIESPDANAFHGFTLRKQSNSAGRFTVLSLLKSAAGGGAVSDGHGIASIRWLPHDGTDYNDGAEIRATVDGAVAANTTPTKLGFYTTTTNAITERLRVAPDGGIFMFALKSGATAGGAGAATDELWVTVGHATLPDGVIMLA